jgi:hypothetical protein
MLLLPLGFCFARLDRSILSCLLDEFLPVALLFSSSFSNPKPKLQIVIFRVFENEYRGTRYRRGDLRYCTMTPSGLIS